MKNIAIYDLDRTITDRPTFTHFLIRYAWQQQALRLALVPIWIVALLGCKLGLYSRKPLKQFGIAMFMGRELSPNIMNEVTLDFIDNVIVDGCQPGAIESIESDREDGCRLVLATAAPEFYAKEIGARLGFDDVIATRHVVNTRGNITNRIDGENCYGPEKRRRVEQWLLQQSISRDDAHIRFYTDDVSDAPLLDFADQGHAINPDRAFASAALESGWTRLNFRKPA
jgi:phosphatidylglycerophosphatase C